MDQALRSERAQELRDYVARWYQVFPSGDASALASLYAEDGRLFLSDLPGVRGAAKIGAFLAQMPAHVEIETRHSVEDIDFLTDDMAVVTGAAWAKTTVKQSGAQGVDASRFVMVMRREPRGWCCLYDVSQHTPDVR